MENSKMKQCRRCKIWSPRDRFSKESCAKDGRKTSCKACDRAYAAKYYASHKVEAAAYGKAYRAEHKVEAAAYGKVYDKAYRLANKGRSAARSAKHHAKKRGQLPGWYQLEEEAIVAAYENSAELTELCAIKFNIDHILPLNGKHVSGLHCLANLQILEKRVNLSKGNKFDPDTFEGP